jgi:hypothetical protein
VEELVELSSEVKIKKLFWTIFSILLALAIYFRIVDHGWEDIVDSDGKGYFCYLPAIFTYHDLDFNYLNNSANNIPGKQTWGYLYNFNGQNVVKYPAGEALLLAPFYLLAELLTTLFGFERNGYSFFYQSMVSVGAITYTSLGFCFLIRLLKSYDISYELSVLVSVSTLFGTNLLSYAVYEPTISHSYSFFAVAATSYYVKRYFLTLKNSAIFYAALFAGLVVIIRPVNGIILFAIPFLAESKERFQSGIENLWRNKKVFMQAIVICLLILSIQSFLWYLQIGKWLVDTYVNESFNWSNPKIIKVLFSYKKGFFTYTPFMFLLIPSILYLLLSKRLWLGIWSLLFFAIVIYVISSWWCWYYGGSFGQRALIEFYPVFAIIISLSFVELHKKVGFRPILIVSLVFILVSLIQTYQYMKHIIHYDSMDKEKFWDVFLKIGHKYEWQVFINKNGNPPSEIESKVTSKFLNEFENCPEGWSDCQYVINDNPLSGNQVAQLNYLHPISPKLHINLKEEEKGETNILIRGWVYTEDTIANTYLVIEIGDQGDENYQSVQFPIKKYYTSTIKNSWESFEIESKISTKVDSSVMRVVVYLKNEDPILSHYDDLAIFLYK